MDGFQDNGTGEKAPGMGLELFGQTDGAKTQQVSIWLREDQIEELEQFKDEYGLSRSEAVRIAVDMMGAGPGMLQVLAQQRAEMLEQMERLAELEELAESAEEIEEAVGSINRAYPDTAMEVKEILQLCRNLRKGEDPPDWFEQYV